MTSVKKQKANRASNGPKILNDERMPNANPVPIMTTLPISPPKQINLTIAKSKQKKMDHYVLQTTSIKGEEGDMSDTIDFILTDNDEVKPINTISSSDEHVAEELRLSGDEEEEEEGEDRTEEHICGKCYKSFRRFSGLVKHLAFCHFDSDYHLRKAEMMKNIEKIEKDAINMENKDICFCCGESYDTFHLGQINCPDCPKSFKTQISYERHIFITHSESDEFPCSICNAKLRTANLLKLHEEQHKNRGKPYACKICGKDFTRTYHLKRHQKYTSCSANANDTMSCKVCNKVFYRLDNLRAHLKHHLGTQVTKKEEYMCPICKNCFYSLSTLNIHTRTHTGERPFACDLCDKKFPSLVALKKHRRYHTGEKPYTCTECNQSFAVKEVLNRHMKRHTGEKPHVCPECGKSFIQATQLRCHSKTHIRPFGCDQCEEKFKTIKQLERHTKIHTSKRKRKNKAQEHKFKCSECKATYTTEEELKTHYDVGVHIPNYNSNSNQMEKGRTDCAVCDKEFDTVKTLKSHIQKVHNENPESFHNAKRAPKVELNTSGSPPTKIYRIDDSNENPIESITTINNNDILPVKNTEQTSIEGGVVVQQFIVDEVPETTTEQLLLENKVYTVIPLENESIKIESKTTVPQDSPKDRKRNIKSLAESLVAAITDDVSDDEGQLMIVENVETEDDIKVKSNVRRLLDILVDRSTLKKFGWPEATEEYVLCKVIENCGYDLGKDESCNIDSDYATRMREYVKLLFSVVIHNDSIKELLNNYPIDDVIEFVLDNDDHEREDDDDDEDD